MMRCMSLSLVLLLGAGVALAGEFTLTTKVPVKLYGFVKGDLAFDSDPVSTGNFFKFVSAPNPAADTAEEYFLTANQTRLGLQLTGPEEAGLKTAAVVEVDFYGGGTENKATPMMRQAYATVAWPGMDLELLAGQTGDLVSPLFPKSVNYAVHWWTGNIGYRRPQFRLTKGFGGLKAQAALARTIGGETTGSPTIQYRLAYEFPLLTDKKSLIGLSGHTATVNDMVDPETKSSSLNVEFSLPLSGLLALKGEYWMGENLDGYLGCIGQAATEGMGYWIDLGLVPSSRLDCHLIYGVDDPDEESEDHPMADGAMQLNTSLSLNVFYKLGEVVTWANEVSLLTTEYKGVGAESGEATRFQTSIIFTF